MVSEQDVKELMGLGNGAQKFVPAADGRTWRVSYLLGVLRIDKYEEGVKIPLSAKRVGGSAIPLPATN